MRTGKRPMPNTEARELNQFTSWNTVSSGIAQVRNLATRLSLGASQIKEIHERSQEDARRRNYSNLFQGLGNIQGTVRGPVGNHLNQAITQFMTKVKSLGGINIQAPALTHELEALGNRISGLAAVSTDNSDKELLNSLAAKIDKAQTEAADEGFLSLGKGGRDVIKSAFEFGNKQLIESASADVVTGMQNVAGALSDPALKTALDSLSQTLENDVKSAKSVEEQFDALSRAEAQLAGLAGRATGVDKTKIDDLVRDTAQRSSELNKNVQEKKANQRGAILTDRAERFGQAVGKVFSYGAQFKRIMDTSVQSFQWVNDRVNHFARMQMAISSERGMYGRQIRGAGIRYGDMMASISAGRSAGMDDRQVINQMVSIQSQLAQARWGESRLIDSAGRWGISTFNENGSVKSYHQLMIDFSRKLKSLGSDAEKLQFITHQGFTPEQMEYVANYESHAKRMEYLKAHPSAMGVLERADILDESGMQAKIDAATRVELRRRQILNQNAIDQGMIPGLIRSLHPENWFFNDWTARQQGVQSAKSELAFSNLTKELQRVQPLLKQNSQALLTNAIKTSAIATTGVPLLLSAEDIQGLALSGGWAEADLKNKGEKSSVHALRGLYARQLNLESLSETEQRKNRWAIGTGIGTGLLTGGGIIGAAIGLASLLAAPFTLGTSLAVGAAALGAGGLAGLAAYQGIQSSHFDDGSSKHIDALRRMKGNAEAIEKYISQYNLQGLTPEMVESKEFQDNEKAAKMLQGAFFLGRLLNAQSLTPKGIDVQQALQYTNDKYFEALSKAAKARGQEVAQRRHEEAIARFGAGDTSIGIDEETAFAYVTHGYDATSFEAKADINRRIAQLRVKNRDKNYQELREQAEKDRYSEWVQANITPELYRKAQEYGTKVAQNPEYYRQQFAATYDTLKEEYDKAVDSNALRYKRQSIEELKAREKRLSEALSDTSSYTPVQLDQIKTDLEQARKIREYKEKVGDLSKEEFIKKAITDTEVEASDIAKRLFDGQKIPYAFRTKEEQHQMVAKLVPLRTTKDLNEQVEADLDIENADKIAWQKARDFYKDDEEFARLSPEEQKNLVKEKHDQFIEAERQKKTAKYEASMVQGEIFNSLTTAGQKRAYLTVLGKKHGISADEISNKQFKDLAEVDALEKRMEAGEQVSEEEKTRYDIWKLGSDARIREQKKEAERKAAEEKVRAEKAAKVRDEDFARRFGSTGAGEVKPTEGAGEVKPTEDDFYNMRKAEAMGYSLPSGGYTQKQIDAYKEHEENRAKKFERLGVGDKDAYAAFRANEDLVLKEGTTGSDEWDEYVKEVQEKLAKGETVGGGSSEYQPLWEPYKPTAEEQKAIDTTFAQAAEAANESENEAARFDMESATMRRLRGEDKSWWDDEDKEESRRIAIGKIEEVERANARMADTVMAANTAAESIERIDQGAQATNKIAENVTAADIAADSVKELASDISRPEQNVTINMGGQTITQNIQGNYDMDTVGMKNGTLEGSAEIRDKAAEAVVMATRSMGMF